MLFNIFLVLHVVAGVIGLSTGTLNIIRKKGDNLHRKAGKIFFYAMLTAGSSALILSIIHSLSFLFVVGIFTIYMTATGRRYITFQQSMGKVKPGLPDWILTVGMIVAGTVFIIFGCYKLYTGNTFGIVMLTFGLISLLFCRRDILNYTGRTRQKNFWQTGHLQKMTGSYVAALTAFIVVNGKLLPQVLPAFIPWLLPTIIFLPVIIRWTIKNVKAA